jgi:hypothetical protein
MVILKYFNGRPPNYGFEGNHELGRRSSGPDGTAEAAY